MIKDNNVADSSKFVPYFYVYKICVLSDEGIETEGF